MSTKTETASGLCASHGQVEATREMPGPSFPFFVYAIRRMIAQRRPYVCPTCGKAVRTG
jgi:hypothetical protein